MIFKIKDCENKPKKYYNFRCRKCGGIISYEGSRRITMNAEDSFFHGAYFHKDVHKNCSTEMLDDEMVVCDYISKSDNPLPEALDVCEDKTNDTEDS